MEVYIMYAIASFLISGVLNFVYKIVTQRKYNVSVFNIYSYVVTTIIALGYFLATSSLGFNYNTVLYIAIFAFINALFYLLSIFSRIESLKNIDTVIFFPLYKTIWPIMITIISIFIFWESLTEKESLWIILWILVPLLLITRKENGIQKNLFLWIVLVILTAILTSISSSASKEIMVRELNVPFFVFITSFMCLLFSFFTNSFNNRYVNKQKEYYKKSVIKISLLCWVLNFLAFFAFTKSLQWNFAIAYTINSFSILIPIILSIIFYKEHFNFKKGFVIFLSIISILLFI